MNGKFKALGLALMAAFALSAVVASAASAQSQLHSGSGSGTTYLTGTSTAGQLDTPAGNVKCTHLSGSGSYATTTATQGTIQHVTYTGCTAFGLTAHIDMMGCDYLVTQNGAGKAIAHVVCPTGAGGVKEEITVTATQGGEIICRVDVPEQTVNLEVAKGGVSPDDLIVTPKNEATLTYTVTYFPSDHTKTKCGTQGVHHDGRLTGAITVTGYSDAAHLNQVNLTYI